jgi:hypothetical protein
MNILEASGLAFLGFLLVVLRAWLVAELSLKVQRRVRQHVKETIASASVEIQEEWGREWLADLEQVISAPISACKYARNLRRSAETMGRGALASSVPSHGVLERAITRPVVREVALWLALLALEGPSYIWRWLQGAIWRAPIVLGIGLSPVGWLLTGLRGAIVVAAIVAPAAFIGALSQTSTRRPNTKRDGASVDPEHEIAE